MNRKSVESNKCSRVWWPNGALMVERESTIERALSSKRAYPCVDLV